MTHTEIRALENNSRAIAWSAEGFDGQTHYGDVLKALSPAFFILLAATFLMLTIL